MYICIIFMFRPIVTSVAMQLYICIQVEFVGEDGYDTGGLTREFFSWFGSAMSQRFMTSTGTFIHNSIAFQVC